MLTMRPFAGEDDYWRIRQFLRDVTARNGDRGRSWHVARLDYWWWFGNPDLEHLDPDEQVLLWETPGGDLGAVVNPEGHAQAFLQVHPDHRSTELLAEMVDAARQHLAEPDPNGRLSLTVWADAAERDLQSVLEARGFRRVDRLGAAEWHHRRKLDPAPPPPPATPGYEVRPLRDGLELLERCYASGLAFHDDLAVARANRDDPRWYRHIQAAPLYRRDLDIVAVASDGSIAAFCTAWFDDVTRTAYLEPAATVPAHRRRGLARAVILEALGRLRAMGCRTVFVGGYSTEANALYTSVMGGGHDVSEPWELAG